MQIALQSCRSLRKFLEVQVIPPQMMCHPEAVTQPLSLANCKKILKAVAQQLCSVWLVPLSEEDELPAHVSAAIMVLNDLTQTYNVSTIFANMHILITNIYYYVHHTISPLSRPPKK